MAALGRRLIGVKSTRVFPTLIRHRQRLMSSHSSVSPRVLGFQPERRINDLLQAYEDYFGLTEVKLAQEKVIEAEKKFLEYQEKRRSKQQERTVIQSKLNTLRIELDKTKRGEAIFLKLVSEEYHLMEQDNAFMEELNHLEEAERSSFNLLSAALRESHEKERLRAERTKYWSLFFSLIGAAIGVIGTSINNYLRMQELRNLVRTSSVGTQDLYGKVDQLTGTVQEQQDKLKTFVSDVSILLGQANQSESETSIQNESETKLDKQQSILPSELLDKQTEDIASVLRQQDLVLEKQMVEIKHLLAEREARETPGNVVYVGPQMEEIMLYTEKNLEWKMKINSIVTVTLVYAGLAITVPLLYAIFKGGGSY